MRHIVIGSLIVCGVLAADAQQRAVVAGKPQESVVPSGAPLTDYAPSLVADAKRKAKNERYEQLLPFALREPRRSGFVTSSAHWAEGLAALPFAQSDAVVVGEVRDAHAFVTPNRRGVYSEFTVAVQEVVKGDRGRSIARTLVAERPGGAVRHANGHVEVIGLSGQGLPRAGVRYVFFLTRNAQDYTIVTAYALDGGTVTPLDGKPVFAAYGGADEARFLATVREEAQR